MKLHSWDNLTFYVNMTWEMTFGVLSTGSSESTHITLHIYMPPTTLALCFANVCHSSVALDAIMVTMLSSLCRSTKKTLQAAAY